MVIAVVMGALLCVLTPAIYVAQTHFSPGAKVSLWWLRLSPAYGPHLVWNGFRSGFHAGERAEFWQNLVITLSWSALSAGHRRIALNRLWREQESEALTGGWLDRWRDFMHGSRERRQATGANCGWRQIHSSGWLAGTGNRRCWAGWKWAGSSWSGCCAWQLGRQSGPAPRIFLSRRYC